jgi:Zn-finger domain-containing protein
MPKKEKEKKKQPEETHLKQNYIDENDLIPFLRDRFGEEFRIRVCLYTDDNLICGCVEGVSFN